MRNRLLLVGGLLLALALGCSPAASPATPTLPGEARPAGEGPTVSAPTVAAAALPTPTMEVLEGDGAQGAFFAPGAHADAPASPDVYRFDSGDLVGATGHPQLVEFLTTW